MQAEKRERDQRVKSRSRDLDPQIQIASKSFALHSSHETANQLESSGHSWETLLVLPTTRRSAASSGSKYTLEAPR